MKRSLPLLAFCVVALGCNGGSKPAEITKPAAGETPVASNDGKAPATTPEPSAASPSLDSVPAELKHDGFEYYGLGNTTPMDMEITSTANGSVLTGSQTTKLEEVKDGTAVFSVERTGQLSQIGNMKLNLEKDGVYVKESSVAKVGDHDLEMPAKLTPGSTWKDVSDLEMNGQSLKITNNYKVVGPAKVTTKKGSYDALLITSTGSGVINGKNVRMESKSWYVKGMGGVKAEINTIYPGGKKDTVTIQLAK